MIMRTFGLAEAEVIAGARRRRSIRNLMECGSD